MRTSATQPADTSMTGGYIPVAMAGPQTAARVRTKQRFGRRVLMGWISACLIALVAVLPASTASASIYDNGAYPNCYNQACMYFRLYENHSIWKNYSYTATPVYPAYQNVRVDGLTAQTGAYRNRTLSGYFIMWGSPLGVCSARPQDSTTWLSVANYATRTSTRATLPAGCFSN